MNILESLLSKKPVFFDGSTGTELQRRGLPPGMLPAVWNLEKPELVKQLHLDYLKAGSQVIETNTFGANRKQLEREGFGDKVEEINRKAAEIAFSAAQGKAFVAGSVGPLGVLIEPYGEVSRHEAKRAFEEQIRALIESGIEIILIETMISLDEALIALEAAQAIGSEVVGITLTFEVGLRGARTPFGETPTLAAQKLKEAGASFVGSNCGRGFDEMLIVAAELREATDLPLLIQPNAGIPEYSGDRIAYPETPGHFAEFVRKTLSLGVEFIGGCCGTTPEHILAGKGALKKVEVEK